MATDLSSDTTVSLLLSRGRSLLSSLSALQFHLHHTSLDRQVEVRPFETALRSELSFLESLDAAAEQDGGRSTKTTSNLSHLEMIWRYARTQLGVRGICKTFSFHQHRRLSVTEGNGDGDEGDGVKIKKEKRQVTVDVVSQNGLTWTKVCALSASSSRFGQDSAALLRIVDGMLAAAKVERVQYLHPEVVVYLPNLSRADALASEVVDPLVARGVSVRLADDSDPVRSPAQGEEEDEAAVEEVMVRPVVTAVTDTVNLDVTALLALVSDITHGPVAPEEWFHPAILAQLAAERDGARMSDVLFPALYGRQLVTSASASRRFREIVDIFGSEREKRRMRLVMGGGEGWQDLSAVGFGGGNKVLVFPVAVIGNEIAAVDDVQAKVVAKLSTVNRAVFMTGWKRGYTTVTSNRAIAKAIEGLIEEGEEGPSMLVLNSSRSLVGRGKSINI